MSRTSKRYALIAGVLVLALVAGLGVWTVANRSTSTEDLAGATSRGRGGSVITITNDGPFLLRVKDQRSGAVTELPSCTSTTWEPKDPTRGWTGFKGPSVMSNADGSTITTPSSWYWAYSRNPRGGLDTTNFTEFPPNSGACTYTWAPTPVAGQTTDLILEITVCIPVRNYAKARTLDSNAEELVGCDKGKGDRYFGTQTSVIKARSSDGGAHAIYQDTSIAANSITDQLNQTTQTWTLEPGGNNYGLRANVTQLPHGAWRLGRGDISPFRYVINGFGASRCANHWLTTNDVIYQCK